MFIDTRTVQNNTAIETTVCIIGGGVAGITLAREMSRAGVIKDSKHNGRRLHGYADSRSWFGEN